METSPEEKPPRKEGYIKTKCECKAARESDKLSVPKLRFFPINGGENCGRRQVEHKGS